MAFFPTFRSSMHAHSHYTVLRPSLLLLHCDTHTYIHTHTHTHREERERDEERERERITDQSCKDGIKILEISEGEIMGENVYFAACSICLVYLVSFTMTNPVIKIATLKVCQYLV